MSSSILYPKEPKSKEQKKHRYRMDYYLIYDAGGTAEFTEYYRTYVGARIAAFLHYYLRSWGGSVGFTDTRKIKS